MRCLAIHTFSCSPLIQDYAQNMLGWQQLFNSKSTCPHAIIFHWLFLLQRLCCITTSIRVHLSISPPPWTMSQVNWAMHWGSHKSCNEYVDFLCEYSDMIEKGLWVVLPVALTKISLVVCYFLMVLYLNVINSLDELVTTVGMMSMMTLFLLQPWWPCHLVMLLIASFTKFCLLILPWVSSAYQSGHHWWFLSCWIEYRWHPKLGLIFLPQMA